MTNLTNWATWGRRAKSFTALSSAVLCLSRSCSFWFFFNSNLVPDCWSVSAEQWRLLLWWASLGSQLGCVWPAPQHFAALPRCGNAAGWNSATASTTKKNKAETAILTCAFCFVFYKQLKEWTSRSAHPGSKVTQRRVKQREDIGL